MLGKIYASFAAVDLVRNAGGADASVRTFLSEVIQTAPRDPERILVTAALYSRYMAIVMTRENPARGQEIMQEFDRKWLGDITTPQAARRRIQVQAAAGVFLNLIHEDEFGMRLPEAILVSSITEESPSREPSGYMIPQSVMYLAPGHLVSWEKLVEATQYGIPAVGLAEQRIPALLVGVEIPYGTQTPDRTSTKLGYVAMRALRKPKHGNLDWFTSLKSDLRGSFGDEQLFRQCSFDTLSLIAAIRIARDLTREHTPAGFSPANIFGKVESVLAKFSTMYPTSFKRNDSILSVALRESRQIDGETDWDITHAARHLRSQIIGLLVQDIHKKTVTWRNEAELWNLYLTHVIEHELSRADKLQMIKFLVQNPKHPLWRTCRGVDQNDVALWAHAGRQLRVDIADRLIECLPEYVVQRCQTIRDINVPQPGTRILYPNDTEGN